MESVTKMVSRRPLVVFSRSTCGMCHGIISFFRNFGANVTVHELDEIQTGQEIEQGLSSVGYNALPVVFIGGELVGGTNEVTSLHLERSLVPMLKRAGAIHL